MILRFKNREKRIELKEGAIQRANQQLKKTIDSDIKVQKAINKILANGITLEIYKASHDR